MGDTNDIKKKIDADTEIENQIISKLAKVVKQKSEKQLLHIEKLAVAKRGSKYKKVEAEPEAVVEQVEPEVEVVKIKKTKVKPTPIPKKVKKVVYVSETEESEESSEEEKVVVVKKKKKPVKPKQKAKPVQQEPEPLQITRRSYFNIDIC